MIENLGSLGELFAYEVANASMSFCGTSITVDLPIAPDFTSEWSGDYYPFTSLNTFGVPSSVAVAGCNDPVACNYEPCAGPDPSLCTYPEAGLDCNGCASDTDGDGICDELEVAGCTDMTSCNYDPAATDDDGTCDDLPAAAIYCLPGTAWSADDCGCAAVPDYCPSDIDGDGATTTTDLLLLLQNFATDCQN